MKRHTKSINIKKGNGADRIFMTLFIIIFALCFLPFALKSMKNHSEPVQPVTADRNIPPDDEILSPEKSQESTVKVKPGLKFSYSDNSVLTPDLLASEAALLYDKNTNTILFRKNSEKICFPASTTKIMTAYVALKYLPSADYKLKVGTELELLQPESSLAYLNPGSTLTLEDALYALLLPSGNDAAYVIAVNTARYDSGEHEMSDKEAVKYFAALMNREAVDMGAESTNFCAPDGYHDPFHYTTAEDLLRISIKAEEFPIISEIVSAPYRETTIESGQAHFWSNGNCLVTNDNGYYLPFATGLKTGFTDEAGYCMVATASENGHDLIAVTLKSPTLAGRYTDAAKLFYSVIDPEKLKEPAQTTETVTAQISEDSTDVDGNS